MAERAGTERNCSESVGDGGGPNVLSQEDEETSFSAGNSLTGRQASRPCWVPKVSKVAPPLQGFNFLLHYDFVI